MKMRRRQSPGPGRSSSENGIFILAPPDNCIGGNKYGRRRRDRCSSFFSFGLLVIIAVAFLVPVLNRAPTAPESIGDVKIVDDVNVVGNKTSSDKQSSPSKITFLDAGGTSSRAAPPKPKGGTSQPPVIPHRLIFTYKYNLMAPSPEDPPFDPKDPITANVLHTISKYQKFWDTNRKPKSRREQLVVSFLSDKDCLEVIAKAEPRLVKIFRSEEKGEYKADICRVAELYMHGGYYFDIDIGVVQPLNFNRFYLPIPKPDPLYHLKGIRTKTLDIPTKDDIVTFATVYNGQGRFFQAFTAATPRHPVLKRSLDYMVAYYEGTLGQLLPPNIIHYFNLKTKNGAVPSRNNMLGMGVGPFTLSMAHMATTNDEWGNYVSHLMEAHGYSPIHTAAPNKTPAKTRYARFLYEVSLDDEDIKKMSIFSGTPLQDALYKNKVRWCNFVCFEGRKVYFYSRVQGSKGCPLEKYTSPPSTQYH